MGAPDLSDPAFPVLTVSEVERSSRWYQGTLGFADVFTLRGHDGTSLLAHLRWSIADPDGFRLVFTAPQPHVLEGRGAGFDEVMARARVRASGR